MISSPFAPTAIAFAKAAATNVGVGSAHAKAVANARLQSFRQIVESRVSARRFEPNVSVPDNVWSDVLRMTMVSPPGDYSPLFTIRLLQEVIDLKRA